VRLLPTVVCAIARDRLRAFGLQDLLATCRAAIVLSWHIAREGSRCRGRLWHQVLKSVRYLGIRVGVNGPGGLLW